MLNVQKCGWQLAEFGAESTNSFSWFHCNVIWTQWKKQKLHLPLWPGVSLLRGGRAARFLSTVHVSRVSGLSFVWKIWMLFEDFFFFFLDAQTRCERDKAGQQRVGGTQRGAPDCFTSTFMKTLSTNTSGFWRFNKKLANSSIDLCWCWLNITKSVLDTKSYFYSPVDTLARFIAWMEAWGSSALMIKLERWIIQEIHVILTAEF